MTERPITFPKIRDGFYRNAETGVHAFKVNGGYLPCTENRYGTSVPITSSPCATLKQARGIMAVHAGRARDEIGVAYVEAVTEHVERAATRAEQAGAPTWRAASARRMVSYASKDTKSLMWLGSAIGEVARLEAWTTEYVIDLAHDEAQAEDAERLVAKDGADALIHHNHDDVYEISDCGVNLLTTPYTYGSPEWDEVTCKPCIVTRPAGGGALTTYGAALNAERVEDVAKNVEHDHVEALAEDLRRYGFSVGDAVVFADPEDIGIDTGTVWRVSAVHAVGTINAYADLTGYAHDGRSASYFDRLALAPRCTSRSWTTEHEFVSNPAEQDGVVGETICYKVRSHEDHRTDRERAERTIHAARDHAGAATGTPYGGEWPGTTVVPKTTGGGKSEMTVLDIERATAAGLRVVPVDVDDHPAWAEYTAALPAPTPAELAEVAVEMSMWTAQRRAAVEAFRGAARSIWSLRAEGLAMPGSPAYASLRLSMQTFREVIHACDAGNEALRRELTSGSL